MRHLLFALVLAAGCASSPPPAPANTTAPAAAPLLAIHEMTFFERDKPQMHLAANGNLELHTKRYKDAVAMEQNEFIGTFSADGTIANADKTKVAHLLADGTLTDNAGKVAPFKLVGDSLVVDNITVTIGANGLVSKNGTPIDPPLRVEGAVDAPSKRTALLALGIVMATNVRKIDESTEATGSAVPATVAP